MTSEKDTIEETIKIPSDMLIDILDIIVHEGIKHEIVNVIPFRSIVMITLFYNKTSIKTQKIISNIQNLLSNYDQYRKNESDEIDWRES